jgi:outer membrane protein X
MKKIAFSILLLSGVVFAKAQIESPFKPFKVDASLGYAMPGGTGAKGGVLFALEPKYEVIPNLSVGLRMEIAVMVRGQIENTSSSSTAKVDAKAAGSYLLTGDYYFTQTKVRPFGGLGLGIYKLAAASATSDGTTTSTASASAGSKFGEMVRAGVELSHFRIGLEYNIVPSTKVDMVNSSGVHTTASAKNGYLGIKAGFVIGGGRK